MDLYATLNAINAPTISLLNRLIDALDFEIIGMNVLNRIGRVADVLIHDRDCSSLLGGEGTDILIGNASGGGSTKMLGEVGDDILIEGGNVYDDFLNGEEHGDDTVTGFDPRGDPVFRDFVEAEQYCGHMGCDVEGFAADNMSSETGGMRLTTEDGLVLCVGISDPETVADRIVFG